MPTLKHLLLELRKLDVDPGEVRIPAALYDDLLDEAEDVAITSLALFLPVSAARWELCPTLQDQSQTDFYRVTHKNHLRQATPHVCPALRYPHRLLRE